MGMVAPKIARPGYSVCRRDIRYADGWGIRYTDGRGIWARRNNTAAKSCGKYN